MSALSYASAGLLTEGGVPDYLSLLSRGLLSYDEAPVLDFEDRFLIEAQAADRFLREARWDLDLILAGRDFPDAFVIEAGFPDRLLLEAAPAGEFSLLEASLADRFLSEVIEDDAFLKERSPPSEHFITEIVFPDLFEESETP